MKISNEEFKEIGMDTKEQLLKECKDLGIISIEADNLTESLIRDAIAAVKESVI